MRVVVDAADQAKPAKRLFPSAEGQYGFLVTVASLMVMVAWGFIHSKLLGWL